MYFWNVDKLVDDLNENKVNQKEQLKYTLAYTVLMVISYDPFLIMGLEYTINDTILTLSSIIITIAGVFLCFRENEKSDNEDFILRFFTIGFPIAIRIAVIAMFIGFTHSMVFDQGEVPISDTYVTNMVDVIIMSIIEIFFYAYMFSKFKLLGKLKSA